MPDENPAPPSPILTEQQRAVLRDTLLPIEVTATGHDMFDITPAAIEALAPVVARMIADERERIAQEIEAHKPALPDWPIAERAGWEHGHANAAKIARTPAEADQ